MSTTDNNTADPKPRVHVIIVAAGRGSRFGGDLPKQFSILGERPVLMHTVIGMARALPTANVVIVLAPEYTAYWQRTCEDYGFVSPSIVAGGETRWESVKKAIDSLGAAPDDIILVHDGVRPLVRKDTVRRVIEALDKADSAIPVMPLTDSLRYIEGDTSNPIDRSQLVAVQTPQAFRAGKLIEAYSLPYRETFTDDASVFQEAGFGAPLLVEGASTNIKITRPRDLEIAALFMGIR